MGRAGNEKGGGGLTIFYRKTLSVHRHEPPVPKELQYVMHERQWLLLHNESRKCAFLHCYLACQSSKSNAYLKWNEDLLLLMKQEAQILRQQGFTILALGDFNSRIGQMPGLEFNTPDMNDNSSMFLTFLNETNMLIINTMPIARGQFTRFMSTGAHRSSSLLDYGLIDYESSNTVTSFVIDSEARFKAGSDHALLNCDLNLGSHPSVKWEFTDILHYNITDKTDYSAYISALEKNISKISLRDFSGMTAEEMLPHISENINITAENTFGVKVKTRKEKKRCELPRSIIKTIDDKNKLASKIDNGTFDNDWANLQVKQQELEKLKLQIRLSISSIQVRRRTKLRSRLLLSDPTKKNFWRFLKNQMKSVGNITSVKDPNGNMLFDEDDINRTVVDHFTQIFNGSPVPIFTNADPIQECLKDIDSILEDISQPTVAPTSFDHITSSLYTFSELEDILKRLPNNKASGE